MSLWNRVNDTSRSQRRLWMLGLGVLLAIGAAVGVQAILGDEDAPRGQARPTDGGMGGMDMGGMAMGGDGFVRLTADQIRTFGVTFGSVERRLLEDEIRTVGIVNFDETRLAGVTLKFGGYVERLHVDFTGRPVRAGEPLVEIYSPELVAAQEELLLAARLERGLAGSAVPGVPDGFSDLVSAARQRLRLWDISEAQIDRVLETGRARRTLTLYAPVSGVVVEKNVLAGQAVQAGQPLYTIADLSEVWIEAELREADAGLVEEGDPAEVELAAFAGRTILGRVEYVYPTLQSASRSLKARIAVANPQGRLKPGMYATVRIAAPAREALTVPASAVLNTGERRLVFVDLGQGRIAPQEVELGRVGAGHVEVLAGLEPGQRVVTSAQYLIDSESNLAETMRSMIGMMSTSDMGSMDMSGETMEGMDASGADMRGMDDESGTQP
ncbi:MAG TPA: efflux RND transporter periplasmic adaptor subunit [Longimicrobiales bacterium]|nr:efflux RND transporter periplasmic adaptor subunit [Longimicrobiales bacterium]